MNLKLLSFSLLLIPLAACERKPETPAEKMQDKVDDALDRRPAEPLQDAAEEAKNKVDDALDRRPAEPLLDAAEDAQDASKPTVGERLDNAADKTGDALEKAVDKTGELLEKAGDKLQGN